MNEEKRKHVVVVGIGLAGSACVGLLDTLAKTTPIMITAIDVRTASISKYAGCRAAAIGESYAYRVCIPNHSILSKEYGVVTNKLVHYIDSENKRVVFEDKSSVTWDILVCASGARNVSPCEPPLEARGYVEQVQFYENIANLLRKSEHITVLGSGAVGTELAGEIKSFYKNKEVAVLSPGSVLVDGCRHPPPKRFYNKVHKVATNMGIKLYLQQTPISVKLSDFGGNSYLYGKREITTDIGSKFTTDIVLLCTGKRLNNNIYPVEWLNRNGSLPVKPNLQLTHRSDVYAIGDINDVDETKQGYYAQKQARMVARNIEAVLKSKPLKTYHPQLSTNILIPLGKNAGISYVGGVMFGSLVTSRIKGKDLFIKDHWSLYRVRKLLMKENNKNWKRIATNTYTNPSFAGRHGSVNAGTSFGLSSVMFKSKVSKSSNSSRTRKRPSMFKTKKATALQALDYVYQKAKAGNITDKEAEQYEQGNDNAFDSSRPDLGNDVNLRSYPGDSSSSFTLGSMGKFPSQNSLNGGRNTTPSSNISTEHRVGIKSKFKRDKKIGKKPRKPLQ